MHMLLPTPLYFTRPVPPSPIFTEARPGDGNPAGDVTTFVSATRPAQTNILKANKEKKVLQWGVLYYAVSGGFVMC